MKYQPCKYAKEYTETKNVVCLLRVERVLSVELNFV